LPGVPALIFDYDGLIADTEALVGRVLVELLAARGVETGFETMVSFMGSTGPANDAAWARQVREWLGPDADPLELDVVAWELIEAQRPEVPLCTGVVELLDRAERAGWKAAIGTGAARPVLEHHLSCLGVLDRFAEVVTAADVTHGKPAPDIFLEVARRLGVAPSECVVLEDSLPGYEAALAAGMRAVICPCAVTRYCTFPSEARVVATLHEVDLGAVLSA
jgi:beta-phosphoglucomutase-like phosphatase (HAD superfamily)